MESASRLCLAVARHGSVRSPRRRRHVSHHDRGPDESAIVRGSSHRLMECPGRNGERSFNRCQSVPRSSGLPQFTPYSPSTDYTLAALAMDWRPPTIYHYSLGLQSKLPGGAVLDVTYAGARDLHPILGRSMNQAPLASPANPIRGQTTNTVANITLRKPYLGWTPNSMYYFGTDGEAWYNSLQASLTQKFRHSFQYQAAYTWARLLSPVPGFTTGSNEFGPSGDQTQSARSNRIRTGLQCPAAAVCTVRVLCSPDPVEIASFPGKRARRVESCHRYCGSGRPTEQHWLTTTSTTPTALPPTGRATAPGCTAKNVATGGSLSHRAANAYINTACFTAPAVIGDDGVATGFGNTPNGILREPDQVDVDLSLSKSQKCVGRRKAPTYSSGLTSSTLSTTRILPVRTMPTRRRPQPLGPSPR